MRAHISVLFAAVLAAIALGCGSSQGSGGTGGGGGGDDDKIHPAGNGQRESEADACDALSQAEQARLLDVGCVGTLVDCPDLLRAETGTACLQYDAGSVQGCIALFGQQSSCDALSATIARCVPLDFPGSAPNGC